MSGSHFISVAEKESVSSNESVKKAVEESIDKLKDLASKKDPEGLCGMGIAYYYGWGIKEDKEKGIEMFESACGGGDVYAMTHLLNLFMVNEYSMSEEKAVEYSKKSAAAGISEGILYLGTAYMDGRGVEQDCKKAAELFRKAANKGNNEARNSLAYLYMEGLGVEQDTEKAFKLFKVAATAGNLNAMYQIGVCFEAGVGTRVDLKKASEWYTKAAERGDTFAMERLGVIYSLGSAELPEDPALSTEWFIQAALGGMLKSMLITASNYLEGYGIEKNEEEGIKWLKLASSGGDEEAKKMLSDIENRKTLP